MKKVLTLVLALIFLLTVCNTPAAGVTSSNRINIAPEVDFSISSKKAADIVIVTDYTGARLAELQNNLSEVKTQGISNGVDLKYTVFGEYASVGTQQSKITVSCYGRVLYFNYTQQNLYGYEAPATINKTDRINYEYCELEPGQALPPLVKGSQVAYDISYTDYQGMGWCYIGKKVVFYNPSNYSATKTETTLVEQWSNGWDSGPSNYYVRSYSNFSLTPTNYWSMVSSYQRDVTGDMKALDFTRLDSGVFRPGSSRYVILLTDNTSTVSYNQPFGNYYPFASMRSDNLGDFINSSGAHSYAVCDGSIVDIKMSDQAQKVSYTNPNRFQNLSVRDIVNGSKDGRIYGAGQLRNALDDIAGNIAKPQNDNVDLVVATDQDASVPTAFVNKLKSRLGSSSDLDTTIVDNTMKVQFDSLQKPEFKKNKKFIDFDTAFGKSYLLLAENGDLFAQGYNYAYSMYYASYSNQKTAGIFGNAAVDKYNEFTKIQSDVKDFELVQYRCNYYVWNMLLIIKNDGSVLGCGVNFSGILQKYNIDPNTNVLYNEIKPSFVPLRNLANIKKVTAKTPNPSSGNEIYNVRSMYTTLVALSNDGKLYYLGDDSSNSLHDYNILPVQSFDNPYQDPYISDVADFSLRRDTYSYLTLIIGTKSGNVYVKGRDYEFKPNAENYWNCSRTNPAFCGGIPGLSISNIYISGGSYPNNTFFLMTNGDLYVYSKNSDYMNGCGTVAPTTPRKVLSNVRYFFYGTSYFNYAINNAGEIYYWGNDSYIPCGIRGYANNQNIQYNTPRLCTTINNVSGIFGSLNPNGLIFYKKNDGSYFYSGNSYAYQRFSTAAAEGESQLSVLIPQKLTPDAVLNISDFIYLPNTGLLALDLNGAMFTAGNTYSYRYDSNTGSYLYTYNFAKTSWGTAAQLCDYIPVPVYAINISAIKSMPLRENSARYFVYISNSVSTDTTGSYGAYYPFGNLAQDFTDYLADNEFNTYAVCPGAALDLRLQQPRVSSDMQTKTLRDLLAGSSADAGNYTSTDPIIEIVSEKFSAASATGTSKDYYLVAGEETAEYNMLYSDYEDDRKCQEQWQYVHDASVYDNSNGTLPTSGQWTATPIANFQFVGKYTVRCKVRDDPKSDDRFGNYRLWSQLSSPFTLFVHRRPVALFSISLRRSGSSYNDNVTNLSYDLDHTSRPDKGIVQSVWQWRLLPGMAWTGGMLPGVLQANKQYQLKLTVTDIEGASSMPYMETIDTSRVNLPPDVDASPQAYNGPSPLNVTVSADDLGENDFLRTDFAWSANTTVPGSWTSRTVKTFVTSPPGDGTWYLHMKAYDTAGNSSYRYRGPYTVNAMKITGVTLEGCWNHWRGQVETWGNPDPSVTYPHTMTVEPHRFLSLECVKINVTTSGDPDKVVIRFSPELEAMTYTDPSGLVYDYNDDYFHYYVQFPQDTTFIPIDNHVYWEYFLPLVPSTKGWDDIRKRPQYAMTVTAWKGSASTAYTIDDIDITGNIYDLSYIQPVN